MLQMFWQTVFSPTDSLFSLFISKHPSYHDPIQMMWRSMLICEKIVKPKPANWHYSLLTENSASRPRQTERCDKNSPALTGLSRTLSGWQKLCGSSENRLFLDISHAPLFLPAERLHFASDMVGQADCGCHPHRWRSRYCTRNYRPSVYRKTSLASASRSNRTASSGKRNRCFCKRSVAWRITATYPA